MTEDERRISFRVGEFAVLADGRRLTLHTDRGFDLRAGSFGRTPDPWAHLTLDQLRTDVNTTVLPDDAEESGEDNTWEWLSGLLRAHGVVVSPDELRVLPYEIEFSERLRSRLVVASEPHTAENMGARRQGSDRLVHRGERSRGAYSDNGADQSGRR